MRTRQILDGYLTVFLLLVVMTSAVLVPPTRALAAPATGCKTGATVHMGRSTGTLRSGGLDRTYILYVSPKYDPSVPAPLVYSVHGWAMPNDLMEQWTQWDKVADQEPLIVVYPRGTHDVPHWNQGGQINQGNDEPDDVQFFRDLTAALEDSYCIDPLRIYVNGLSNGAGMSNRLACEAADLFAAIGGVAGVYNDPPGGCKPSRPISVMGFHGNADPIGPFKGDLDKGLIAPQQWAADWASRDGCTLTPQSLATTGDTSGVAYRNCKDGTEVVFYVIDGGGHSWPGAKIGPIESAIVGKTSSDIDATATLWKFFKAHPMPKQP